MMTENDLALSCRHTIQYTDNMFWNDTLVIYTMLLANDTPIHLIK